MCEDWLGQEDAALLQGLPLSFMDRHSPSQAYWELSATEYEGKLRSATAERYARQQVALSSGSACENPHVEKPWADFQDETAAAIAYT